MCVCLQPADQLRLLSLKTRGQHLPEESTLAELGIENDEEVAVSHQTNGTPCTAAKLVVISAGYNSVVHAQAHGKRSTWSRLTTLTLAHSGPR